MQTHWDKIYSKTETEQLGWYQAEPQPSLDLIKRCGLASDQPLLDVGVGASTLIDHLLDQGFQGLIATDISEQALAKLQARLGVERAERVQWVADDITQGEKLAALGPVMLWHDRAVFHFLIEDAQRDAYRQQLLQLLAPGGFVVLATFAPDGAEMCSGLPVRRHSAAQLAEFLGDEFTLLESLAHTYYQPSGNPRPFTYTRFQRAA